MRTGPTYAATAFTREELQELALTGGVRERIRQLEVQVRRLQRAFPQVFVNQEPIVLLAPEPRTDGKTWPLVKPKPVRKPWSAEARQQHSQTMRAVKATRKTPRMTPKRRRALRANLQKARAALVAKRATSQTTAASKNGHP